MRDVKIHLRRPSLVRQGRVLPLLRPAARCCESLEERAAGPLQGIVVLYARTTPVSVGVRSTLRKIPWTNREDISKIFSVLFGVCMNLEADGKRTLSRTFGAELELCGAILNAMTVLRHLLGSDPSIEVADEERLGTSAVTLHFYARQPKPALSVEQEPRSVVVVENQAVRNAFLGDPADVTQVTRTRGIARWLSPKHWIILLESNWVVIVVGLSVLVLLICAVRLHQV